jgi:hypothetical protein
LQEGLESLLDIPSVPAAKDVTRMRT